VAVGRNDDAMRECNLAIALRPNEATVLYNVACIFCQMGKQSEGMDALKKAWTAGFRESDWARRDPDLALLRGDPEFDRLYPPTQNA
jgi:non-specific serine/threonine protein kinase